MENQNEKEVGNGITWGFVRLALGRSMGRSSKLWSLFRVPLVSGAVLD